MTWKIAYMLGCYFSKKDGRLWRTVDVMNTIYRYTSHHPYLPTLRPMFLSGKAKVKFSFTLLKNIYIFLLTLELAFVAWTETNLLLKKWNKHCFVSLLTKIYWFTELRWKKKRKVKENSRSYQEDKKKLIKWLN